MAKALGCFEGSRQYILSFEKTTPQQIQNTKFYDTVMICMIPSNPCVLSRMTQALKKVTHSTSNSSVMDREMTQIQLLTYLEIQMFSGLEIDTEFQ